jgi:hypothetical protein
MARALPAADADGAVAGRIAAEGTGMFTLATGLDVTPAVVGTAGAAAATSSPELAGQSAQPMPAIEKSATPTAGSQSGVRGSGREGGWACAESDMERPD